MHEEHLKLLGVVHDKLKESVRQNISGSLVRAWREREISIQLIAKRIQIHSACTHIYPQALTIADAGLGDGAFKSSSNSGIDTLGLSPGGSAQTSKLLVLVTLEALSALLDDLGLD